MDIIKIMLEIGNYSEYFCLFFGVIIGILFEHILKVKTFHVRNKNGELHEIRRKVPNVLSISMLLVIGIFPFAMIKIPQDYTTIPNVISLSYEEAAAKLHSAGLSCSDNYGRYGDVVTSVSPADEYVRAGSMIDLTLGRIAVSEHDAVSELEADGESDIIYDTVMPDLYMIQEQAAEKYLRNAGFYNVEILPQYTDTTVAGYVLRTEPFADDPVNYEDTITLYVSVNEVNG